MKVGAEHRQNGKSNGNGAAHATTERAVTENTPDAMYGTMSGDAPMCSNCGHITIRNGTCYKCVNCGTSMGCS